MGVRKKIRVLQVMDKCAIRGAPIHGVSRLLLTWWPGFENSNIELELSVLRGGHGTCDCFKKIGVDVIDLARSKVDPRTIFDLMKIVKERNIDILHCHGYGATTFGRIAGVIAGKPVIVHEHMVDDGMPFYQELVDRLLGGRTSVGIAISNAVKEFMVKKRHIPHARMKVVYNTIPESYFQEVAQEKRRALIEACKLPEGKRYVGIIGRLDPIKGHEYFIRAAKEVLASNDDVHFLIVGDGELRSELEALSNSLGVAESITFLGHRTDVLVITSVLDILVSASLAEGLGMSVIEAMAQGKPIVASAVGGIPELITDGESGVLVPAQDFDALGNGILQLLNDSAVAARMGHKAREVCINGFKTEKSVKELSEIYRSLLMV